MSDSKKDSNPEVTVEPTEEVLEGELADDTQSPGPVKRFLVKYKTWLVATGAAVGGFVLHALLSEPNENDYAELESYEEEDSIESNDSE